jgi:hypothetical protein
MNARITPTGSSKMVKESLRYIAAPLLFPCDVFRRAAHASQSIVRVFSDRVRGVFVIRLEPIRNSYQIRQRARVHFLHNLATMNADSYFADAKLAGNLLAYAPLCKQSHDFLFAIGQARKSLVDLRPSASLRGERTVAFDPLAYRIE